MAKGKKRTAEQLLDDILGEGEVWPWERAVPALAAHA